MTKTLHAFTPAPGTRAESIARINAVSAVYNDLYDAFEEGTTVRRVLETHEALFISAIDSISRASNKTIKEGFKTWGDGAAYEALCNLTYRDQAAKMEAALASYKAICEELDGISSDIAEIMNDAAE
jgi:hypothetical protein